MKSRLIILSSSYPIDSYETFLEAELNYLKNEFEEVLFLPIDVPVNPEFSYDYKVLNKPKPTGLFFGFLKSLISVHVISELFRIFCFEKKMKMFKLKTALRCWMNASQLEKQFYTYVNQTPTVFYSYWGMDGAVALAKIKRRYPNTTVVSRFHGWDVFKQANELNYLPFRSFIASSIPNLYPISNAGKREIEKWNPKAKPQVAYLGAHNNLTFELKRSSELVLISISNFNNVKRMPLFFETMSHLKTNVKWIHFGGGERAKNIIDLGSRLIPSNVSFEWKGMVKHEEVLNFLKETPISCLLNLSSSEGIPVSMMEVMSFGVPVFATNVGGVSELIDETCGHLIEVNLTASEIANELDVFLSQDLVNKGIAAQYKWKSNFNAAVNYQKFANLLKQLIHEE